MEKDKSKKVNFNATTSAKPKTSTTNNINNCNENTYPSISIAAFISALSSIDVLTDLLLTLNNNNRFIIFNTADNNGLIHHCIISALPAALNILLEYGADPNIGDNEGDTALHYAIKKLDGNCIKILTHYGCDCNKLNNLGLSPVQQITPIHFELFSPWISSLSSSFNDNWFENPYKITTEERKQIRLCFECLDSDHDGIIAFKDWSNASGFIDQSHSNEQIQAFYNYFTVALLSNKNKEKPIKPKETKESITSKDELKSPTVAAKARPGSARPLPSSTTKASAIPQSLKLQAPDFIIFQEMEPISIEYNRKLIKQKYLLPEYIYQPENAELIPVESKYPELSSPDNKNAIKISVIEAKKLTSKTDNSTDFITTFSNFSIAESPSSNVLTPGIANVLSSISATTVAKNSRPQSAARNARTSSMM